MHICFQIPYHLHTQNDIENNNVEQSEKKKLKKDESIVDPKLELTDPTPDVHELFEEFDLKYFGGLLARHHVAVEWDNRIYLSAGKFVPTCLYHHSKPSSVNLSSKLLKYRPRKDLVETLLVRKTFYLLI